MTSKQTKDYVELIYGTENARTAKTDYPTKLISYLFDKYQFKKDEKILDLGCGRGEFLNAFCSKGLIGYGIDASNLAIKECPTAKINVCDLETEQLPYPDNYFDIIFSKSVFEHFHRPEKLMKEVYRISKRGAKVINLVPSWEYCSDIYYEDYTHRTPYMLSAFRDLHILAGFKNVETSFFKQLPVLWHDKIGLFKILSYFTRVLTPSSLRYKFKWIKFSKEVMIIAYARK